MRSSCRFGTWQRVTAFAWQLILQVPLLALRLRVALLDPAGPATAARQCDRSPLYHPL